MLKKSGSFLGPPFTKTHININDKPKNYIFVLSKILVPFTGSSGCFIQFISIKFKFNFYLKFNWMSIYHTIDSVSSF